MDRGPRALVAVPLILALAGASFLVQRAASANLIAQDGPIESLARAVDLTPADPTLLEVLGLAVVQQGQDQPEIDHGLRLISDALTLRPVSPYGWSTLAEARYRAGVADETFHVALANAARLGPNEPRVQETVALYGLAVWSEVGPQTRDAIERMLAAGVRRDPGAVLTIAQRRGRLAIACHFLGTTAHIPDTQAELCKSGEEK